MLSPWVELSANRFTDEIYPCTCGRDHPVCTRKILIEPGALEKVPDIIRELGWGHNLALLADKNTFAVAGERLKTLLMETAEAFS